MVTSDVWTRSGYQTISDVPLSPPQPLPDCAYIGADGIAYGPLASHETSPFPFAFRVCETPVERLVSYILAIGWPHSWRDKRLVVRVPCGRRVVDAERV